MLCDYVMKGDDTMPKKQGTTTNCRDMRPAITPEANESQLVSLATNLVRQRLIDGTASSQEVTHFLKLGSRKEILEREKLEEENKLLKAKTEAIQSQKRVEELYTEALDAMRKYSGQGGQDEY